MLHLHRRLPSGCYSLIIWSSSAHHLVIAAFTVLALCTPAEAQPSEPSALPGDNRVQVTAPVVIDGRPLFRVRGVTAYPAAQRAEDIAARIVAFAADTDQPTDSIHTEEGDQGTKILAGNIPLMTVFDEDGRIEEADRHLLARAHVLAIARAVTAYRADRASSQVIRYGLLTLAATVVAALAAFGLVKLLRVFTKVVERRYRRRIERIEAGSFKLIRAKTIWDVANAVIVTLWVLLGMSIIYFYLHFVLSLYPWTRWVADHLLALLLGPITDIVSQLFLSIPSLVVIVIIAIATKYLLTLTRRFFEAIGKEQITLANFDPEWANPTFKIVRMLIIAFAVVIAYPYIPGSQSAAFKGITIFFGVLFSLGSSSLIANLIAGYTLTYRRAFHVGDRIAIGNTTGDVTKIRLLVTHLRSIKNEELIIPNSTVLGSQVTNYSSLVRDQGLILHTTVGIGYETPWRQVEAMLLMAADRTAGLLRDPLPFVLQKGLGDFCVTYELNVYCDRPLEMNELYAQLHRSILDVFNEYGVQIMTPAYVADPVEPKVVAKEQWFTAPAQSEDRSSQAQKVCKKPSP